MELAAQQFQCAPFQVRLMRILARDGKLPLQLALSPESLGKDQKGFALALENPNISTDSEVFNQIKYNMDPANTSIELDSFEM